MNKTIKDFNRPTIFVCVTRKYDHGENGVKWNQVAPEDWSRGCWLVDDAKANQCEVLVAIVRGTIVGMWDIDMSFPWRIATSPELPTRKLPPMDKRRKVCRIIKGSEVKYRKFIGATITESDGGSFMHGQVRYGI